MNLQDVKSGFNLSKMNENFKKIQEAFNENVLYRKVPVGQPNQMEADLDMNDHRIYNTSAPKGPYDLVRVIDVQEMGGTVVPGPPPPPAPAPSVGGDFFRIAVIGDSLAGQQNLFDEAWPAILERSLNSSGANVQVRNFAINAYTYNSALNTQVFGSKTMVEAVIEYEPEVVIVSLGANDSFRAAQQGSATSVISEAQALFSAVRDGLPSSLIFYGSTTMYDTDHITLSAPQNRHILPAWWKKKTTGLLTGLWCKEIQTDQVAPDIRSAMQYWSQLDNSVRSFQEVDGTIIIPLWKVSRLGGVGPDGLHPIAVGHKMMHAAVRNYLQANVAFRGLLPNISSQGGGEYNDFDLLFAGLLTNTGGEFVLKSNPSVFILQNMRQFGPWSAELVDSWFYPSKGSVVSSNLQHNRSAPQIWMIRGSKPNTVVQVTGNESSWLPTNLVTDSRGDALECGSYAGLPNGTYTLRYRVDDEAYGPLSIVLTGTESGGGGGSSNIIDLRPLGVANDIVRFNGTEWEPTRGSTIPGWAMLYDSPTTFRMFPVTDTMMRFADGAVRELGGTGTVFGLGHSGTPPAAANTDYYVYLSQSQDRLIFNATLPVIFRGQYVLPGDISFMCIGRIRTDGSKQLVNTESQRLVVSLYNQPPRSLRIAPLASDTGLSQGQNITIGSCSVLTAFTGALIDISAFGQVGATSSASYSRASFSHSPQTSTLGGDVPTVASHSLRVVTSAGLGTQQITLQVRGESGVSMLTGGNNGLQANGVVFHNW